MVAVIDLGERTIADPEPPMPINGRLVLRIVLAVVAVAGVLLAGGSAWPLGHGPHELWRTTVGDSADPPLFDDTTLYLKSDTTLTAYDRATGRVRWKADTGGDVSVLLPAGPRAPILLMADFDNGASLVEVGAALGVVIFSHHTFALDKATGRRLWQIDGELGQVEAGTALVGTHDDGGNLLAVKAIRLSDGATLWSTPLSAQSVWTAFGSQVVTSTEDGAVTVRRLVDGSVLRTGRIAPVRDADLYPVGDYLVADRMPFVTVYDPGTLAALWHTPGQIEQCGPVICILDEDGMTAREPSTGAVLWRLADVVEARSAGDGKLLVDTGPRSGLGWAAGPYSMIDARSGRRTAGPIFGFLPSSRSLDGSVVLLHDTSTPAYSSSIIRVSAPTGRAIGLGTMPRPVHDTCAVQGETLACETSGRLIVTALS
jgi:hypothetical protein